jgi:hypothetical protein
MPYTLLPYTLTRWSFYPIVVFLGRAQCHLISAPHSHLNKP